MELLSPVGNIDNLIAAVQNGADAVYLGASMFNARANAQNFSDEELKEAIMYARKRGVDVHLTLNILMYNNEINDALEVAKNAYEAGISAIIVQDIGLAKELIKYFPDLPIHCSTQMTISNVHGVKLAEKMGFKRVVLSRELSLKEISYIKKNTSLEIECFGHGALCVSYSGQCLFSSIVGKRSGNRGLCAGPCRLAYSLLKDKENIENGYLLSPKDICTLEILPQLIDAGIDSIKIEGRKKSYEYVSIVTKIYRKYIDLAKDKSKEYKIDYDDLKELLQIYNRGGMGTGYFENRQDIVYSQKPNHLGIYLGSIKAVNRKQKQVTIDLTDEVSMGDVISINDETSYISQIINKNTVGEIKNLKNINIGDEVYKIVDGNLNKKQWEIYKKEVRKVDINARLYEDNEKIYLELYNDKISVNANQIKEKYNVNELDNLRIISQIRKTGNTIFNIKDIKIEVNNLKLPISILNNLRRNAIENFENELEKSIKRKYNGKIHVEGVKQPSKICSKSPKINLYIQNYNKSIDYSKIKYNDIYIQFKDLIGNKQVRDCIVCLPNIIDDTYENLIRENLDVFDKVKAVMISHISQVELLKSFGIEKEIVGNYTLNITNNLSEKVAKDLGIKRFTISPELDKNTINSFEECVEKELIVYGRTCLMTSKYCPIGKNGKCNLECKKGVFELKDRKNFIFPVVSDSTNCHSRIYNSKILSVEFNDKNVDYVRIDLLNETENEIEKIFSVVKTGKRLNGIEYTNGNL